MRTEAINIKRSRMTGSAWAWYALGFGLGGFFDGILLHQILQWHHLLSGVEQFNLDIRLLILADGLFHVVMYAITIFGLWLLWRGREEILTPSVSRHMPAGLLVGFGVWHVLDAVLSHWLLGLHRIRMDTQNPIVWDLLWFFTFGLVPLLLGTFVARRDGGKNSSHKLASFVAVAFVVSAGAAASLPAPRQTTAIVLFHPGMQASEVFAAIDSIGARVLWSDASGQVWGIKPSPDHDASALYRHGALLVNASAIPLGCFNWTKI